MWFEIIGLACVGVLWICSEPTIRLREFILRNHQGFFRRLLECAMCSTFHIYFWYQLFYYGNIDIIGSSICAVISEILYQKLNNGI
jgi:hypothetical protein